MFETISLLGNAAVNLSDKCVKGITVNREICERYVFNSIGLVTYLNPYISTATATWSAKSAPKPAKACAKSYWNAGC